jgi:hypothetical protein
MPLFVLWRVASAFLYCIPSFEKYTLTFKFPYPTKALFSQTNKNLQFDFVKSLKNLL